MADVAGTGRDDVDRLRSSLELLRRVASATAGSGTLERMLRGCAEAVVEEVPAAFARVWVRDGEALRLRASAGLYTHLDGPHSLIPIGAYKIGRIAAQRTAHLTNTVADDPNVSDPEWARREGMVAFAGYPLLAGGELLGVLGLFARDRLDESVLEVLAAAADSIALGVQRILREEADREERAAIDALQAVAAAMNEHHRLDGLVQTATDAARALMGARFSAFFYNAVTEDGDSYMLYAISGVERSAFESFPLPRKTAIFRPTFEGMGIVRSDDITADPNYGQNAPHHGMPAGHLPVRSYLAAPVVAASGEVLGGLFLGHDEPGVFTTQHERLLEGIAERAARAVERAQVYEREHRLALRLQESFLPQRIPDVVGASIAARYRPASRVNEVGGDWYDITPLPDGSTALSVGDVSGHDLQAAIAMGQLRNALKAYSLDDRDPATALDRLDAFLAAIGLRTTATAVQAVHDPAAGTLTIARAGHLPPLIVDDHGVGRYVELAHLPGSILGVRSRRTRRSTVVPFTAGYRAVFFTDGLVERRDEPLDAGLERLRQATGASSGLDADATAERLMDAMIRDHRDDDAAVVVLVAN